MEIITLIKGGLKIDYYSLLKNKTAYIRCFILFITIGVILFTGCNRKQSPPAPAQQSAQSEQKADKMPDQLKSVESSIEKIINTLNGPSVGVKEEKGNKEAEKTSGTDKPDEEKSKQEDQEGKGSKENGKQEGGGSEKKSAPQPTAPKPSEDPFNEVVSTISALHYQWNNYMPLAAKEGANKSLIDGFSNSLNNLTNSAMSKNRVNTLLAASSAYAFIPDFQSLYKTKVSPELKRIRHYIRDAILNSMISNWAQSDRDINSLKSSWSFYKAAVPKEQQELSSKLELSIYELEKVIKEKDQSLSEIKGKVALSNTEELEKALQGS